MWGNYAVWKETHQEYHITRDLLQVNWKSQKYRGTEYNYASLKLTPTMLNALKSLLLGKLIPIIHIVRLKPGSRAGWKTIEAGFVGIGAS